MSCPVAHSEPFEVEMQPVTPPGYRRARFLLSCAGRQTYILIGELDGKPKALHQLRRGGGGIWSIDLVLKAGEYRYRFYVDGGHLTTYVQPETSDAAPIQMDGLDAVLSVRLSGSSTYHGAPGEASQQWIS